MDVDTNLFLSNIPRKRRNTVHIFETSSNRSCEPDVFSRRYHEPPLHDFNIIKAEYYSSSFDETILSAIKRINDYTGPDGILLSLFLAQ